MKGFIKVHTDRIPVWINIKEIVSILTIAADNIIYCTTSLTYHVKETPDEIIKLIDEAQPVETNIHIQLPKTGVLVEKKETDLRDLK